MKKQFIIFIVFIFFIGCTTRQTRDLNKKIDKIVIDKKSERHVRK